MPSLTGREGKLIISWRLEAKVLIDNHRTALRVYIAIRLRDKGWPKALITAVTRAKTRSTTSLQPFDEQHYRNTFLNNSSDSS